MKQLLALLLAVVIADVSVGQDAYLVLDGTVDPNDLNPKDLEDPALKALANQALANFQRSSALTRETFNNDTSVPPAYLDKVSSARASVSADLALDSPVVLQEATARLAPALEPDSLQVRPLPRPLPCHYYQPQFQCNHKMNILTWFPLSRELICFIPWANEQRATYATCSCSTCNIRPVSKFPTYYDGLGKCRPSCYERRLFKVWCWNFRMGRPYWTAVTRNLPQSCRCSTL